MTADTTQDARPDGSCDRSQHHAGSEATPDFRKLAEDWVTIWQSELNALATDREAQQAWQNAAAFWAEILTFGAWAAPRGNSPPHAGMPGADDAPRPSRPAAPTGTAPAAAAPDAGGTSVDELQRHVAELERRLAELERGTVSRPSSHARSRRKRST